MLNVMHLNFYSTQLLWISRICTVHLAL